MKKTPEFEPLKKSRLYEEVADRIKQSIYSGELEPGDRLPPERELCKMFNVGRPTIREALRTLCVMGLVEIHRGTKGAVVTHANVGQYMEAMLEQLSWLIKADRKTLEELWEVRKYIEFGIANAVAGNASDDDLKKLDALIVQMEACGDDIDTYFPIGIEFHKELALMSGNQVFFFIWELCHGIIEQGFMPILHEVFSEGPAKLIEANRIMLEAIKSRNLDQIEKAMKNHADLEASIYFDSK